MKNRLRVLALAPYPEEAASTRFRIAQFIPLLESHGIRCELRPFVGEALFKRLYRKNDLGRNALSLGIAAASRAVDLLGARRWDVIFIQREAALIGPPLFERAVSRLFGKPIVLDLDDPLWIAYESPVYGKLGRRVRCLGKTAELIRRAAHVVCGNNYIAEHVAGMGRAATVLPTIVDTDKFSPKTCRAAGGPVVLGWIGTHTTLGYLETVAPALERLSQKHRFRLRVVGGGRRLELRGVEVEQADWSLGREVEDFRSLDVGLYPLVDDGWSRYKSGFKAIQYACCGVPYVASPVGVVRELAAESGAGLLASSTEEWYEALDRLLSDGYLRLNMGSSGRAFAVERYRLEDQAARLGEILRAAAGNA